MLSLCLLQPDLSRATTIRESGCASWRTRARRRRSWRCAQVWSLWQAKASRTTPLRQRLGTTRPTVLLWRKRFAERGVPGLLKDAPRPGRHKAISPEVVKRVVDARLHTTARAASHWRTRTMAAAQGLSHMTVPRIWKQHGLQPHRLETFKLSGDRQFVEKLRDVVGLYLIRPIARWCCRSTRKARFKRSIAPSPDCR